MFRIIVRNQNLVKKFSTKIEDELHLQIKDQIAIIGLNRPSSKNSLSIPFLSILNNAIEEVASKNNVRCLIIRSLVPGVFCAGGNYKEKMTYTHADVACFIETLSATLKNLANLEVPTIAAMDGAAIGGGLELALACDMRTTTNCSKIGQVETKLGIMPGAGGTQRLARLINPSIAKELVLTGRIVNGIEAYNYGIVNRVLSQNGTKDAAFLEALEIAKSILETGPIGSKLAKKAIDRGLQVDLNSGLEIEIASYAECIPTKDRVEALKAIAEKRKPVYKGE